MMYSLRLHVMSLVRMGGGTLYKDKPPETNIVGFVPTTLLPSGKRAFLLEAGFYTVTFEEVVPEGFEGVTFFNIRQNELNLCGATLSLNTQPFYGLLHVGYSLQVEVGALLGSLMYHSITSELPTDPSM